MIRLADARWTFSARTDLLGGLELFGGGARVGRGSTWSGRDSRLGVLGEATMSVGMGLFLGEASVRVTTSSVSCGAMP